MKNKLLTALDKMPKPKFAAIHAPKPKKMRKPHKGRKLK